MGIKTGLAKITFLTWLGYEIAKNTIIPNDVYAQEKNDRSKTNPWDSKTREEKINDLHHTDNRIMPLVEVEGDGVLENVITALLDGHLFTPATKEMTLNYGDTLALDLTGFPMRKGHASISFKGASLDEAFNFIYNGINKSYSAEKNVVMNKYQVTKNHEQLERILKMFEVVNPKWAEYIKDGKINDKEFKDLTKGIYVVEITGRDNKGKAIERGYMFVTRGDDNTDKVKIVEKPVEIPKPYPVYKDTCITPPYKSPKESSLDIGVGGGAIYEGNNKKLIPQGRVAITLNDAVFGADMELGAHGGYSKFKENQENIEFDGPFGVTTLHQSLEKEIYNVGGDVLFGGDNLKIGVGANYYTTTSIIKQKFDEILRDHAGNIVKERYNISLPNEEKTMNYWRYGPRVGLRAGNFEVVGLADFQKNSKPSYGINLIYHILRK